jgi:hypothetical protein
MLRPAIVDRHGNGRIPMGEKYRWSLLPVPLIKHQHPTSVHDYQQLSSYDRQYETALPELTA